MAEVYSVLLALYLLSTYSRTSFQKSIHSKSSNLSHLLYKIKLHSLLRQKISTKTSRAASTTCLMFTLLLIATDAYRNKNTHPQTEAATLDGLSYQWDVKARGAISEWTQNKCSERSGPQSNTHECDCTRSFTLFLIKQTCSKTAITYSSE